MPATTLVGTIAARAPGRASLRTVISLDDRVGHAATPSMGRSSKVRDAMLERGNPKGIHAPAPTYCHVVDDRSRGIVYVAGQVGVLPDGKLAGPDMASQVRQVLANFDVILRELSLDRSHFVKRTVYVTDMEEYFAPEVREPMGAYFGSTLSTSTLVQVVRLASREWKIEIEAVLHRA
jgi:2-iminobutanoate/2-iminopropanoate deaminase